MSEFDEKIVEIHDKLVAYVENDMELLDRAMSLVEQDMAGRIPNIKTIGEEFDAYGETVKWINTIRNRRRMERDAIVQ